MSKSLLGFSDSDKSKAIEDLIIESTPDKDFFFMVVLSVLMATFGLLINNIPVLIASMLIAPLLSPVLSLALGIVMADNHLIGRSVITLAKAVVLAVFLSAMVTFFFLPLVSDGLVGYSDAAWDIFIILFFISVLAGTAASFATVSPTLNAALPAAAIAVTFIPPIAAIGIGIAKLNWTIISNAVMIFMLNVLGIVFSALVMFSLMRLYTKRVIARRTAIAEDQLSREK